MNESLPTSADDPRLTAVDLHGLPESLKGKTALDVAAGDGFWAFEMERRGADRVVAIDVARTDDSTLWLAHAMRESNVECRVCNVYDLSPETVGTFDVVFCASMLLHLQNPLAALVNIRSVTKEMAIVSTLLSDEIDRVAPDEPWVAFGHPDESVPGAAHTYWGFNTRALQEAMEYAGFARTEPLEPVTMTPASIRSCVVIGYPNAGGSR